MGTDTMHHLSVCNAQFADAISSLKVVDALMHYTCGLW